MTNDNIEAKALALWNEVRAEREYAYKQNSINRETDMAEALCRAIEQHEAFKQEVSDAVTKAIGFCKDGRPASAAGAIGAFVIRKPKPDPLAQTLGDFDGTLWEPEDVVRFRAALEARGLKIVESK